MNQAAILELYAGGPGSGCHGPDCGRPASGERTGLQKMLDQVKGVWNENNVWVKLGKYGHPGNVAPFSGEELKELTALKPPGECKIGFCFQNAQEIASWNNDPRLKYVEGLVTVHGVPIDHAYVEFNGKVYDPTLAEYKAGEEPDYSRGGKFPQLASVPEYVGVTVPKGEIPKFQLKTGKYSPLSHAHGDEALQKKIWK